MKNYSNYKDIKQLSEIVNECSEYVDLLNSIDDEEDRFLYRGIDSDTIEDILSFNRREERKPMDMPLLYHDILNELFSEKFGWKCRNGVFVRNNNTVGYMVIHI